MCFEGRGASCPAPFLVGPDRSLPSCTGPRQGLTFDLLARRWHQAAVNRNSGQDHGEAGSGTYHHILVQQTCQLPVADAAGDEEQHTRHLRDRRGTEPARAVQVREDTHHQRADPGGQSRSERESGDPHGGLVDRARQPEPREVGQTSAQQDAECERRDRRQHRRPFRQSQRLQRNEGPDGDGMRGCPGPSPAARVAAGSFQPLNVEEPP